MDLTESKVCSEVSNMVYRVQVKMKVMTVKKVMMIHTY